MPIQPPTQAPDKKSENELGNPKTKTKRRPWPQKRRALHRALILKTKPWVKSTGPRTKSGKDKSKINAYKHGSYRADLQYVRMVLRMQSAWLREYKKQFIAKHNKSKWQGRLAARAARPPRELMRAKATCRLNAQKYTKYFWDQLCRTAATKALVHGAVPRKVFPQQSRGNENG